MTYNGSFIQNFMSIGALEEEIFIISKNVDIKTDRQTPAVHRIASQLKIMSNLSNLLVVFVGCHSSEEVWVLVTILIGY